MWLFLLSLLAAPAFPTQAAPVMVVNPGHLIDGDEVTVHVWSGGGERCRVVGSPIIERRGRTFRIDTRVRGVCTGSGASVISLGRLDAGDYTVENRGQRVTFTVEPAGTDPGPLPGDLKVKLAIVEQVGAPGQCFGMPGPAMPRPRLPDPHRQLLLRQMRAAYAGKTDRELEALLDAAGDVHVAATGAGRWTYGFTDGHCCSIHEMAGEVELDGAGRFVVGKPRTVQTRSMPC